MRVFLEKSNTWRAKLKGEDFTASQFGADIEKCNDDSSLSLSRRRKPKMQHGNFERRPRVISTSLEHWNQTTKRATWFLGQLQREGKILKY